MQPPTARSAGLPPAGFGIVQDEDRDDRAFARGGGCKRGLIGETEVAPEPDDDGTIGHDGSLVPLSEKTREPALLFEMRHEHPRRSAPPRSLSGGLRPVLGAIGLRHDEDLVRPAV